MEILLFFIRLYAVRALIILMIVHNDLRKHYTLLNVFSTILELTTWPVFTSKELYAWQLNAAKFII